MKPEKPHFGQTLAPFCPKTSRTNKFKTLCCHNFIKKENISSIFHKLEKPHFGHFLGLFGTKNPKSKVFHKQIALHYFYILMTPYFHTKKIRKFPETILEKNSWQSDECEEGCSQDVHFVDTVTWSCLFLQLSNWKN